MTNEPAISLGTSKLLGIAKQLHEIEETLLNLVPKDERHDETISEITNAFDASKSYVTRKIYDSIGTHMIESGYCAI